MISDPKGLAVRLGFCGYRVFLAYKPDYNKYSPDTIHVLAYQDYNLEMMDNLSIALGYFPNAEQIAKYHCEAENRNQRNNKRGRPAFVINGRYERLWVSTWYEAVDRQCVGIALQR